MHPILKFILYSRFLFHQDWCFEDGGMPNDAIVNSWLKLVDFIFDSKRDGYNAKETIAVHCKAGLGRAPVLVALALMELGMEPINAIGLIRFKRRGAINGQQLQELVRYQKRDSDAKGQSKPKRRFSGRPILFGRRRNSVKDNLVELSTM
uniref:Tyrosine specific protein phosphatases domain-containing protein n=1 Tax=Rhodosorus marinus TaxID=101924 RepID=A0A7S2ZQE6_9RHOD